MRHGALRTSDVRSHIEEILASISRTDNRSGKLEKRFLRSRKGHQRRSHAWETGEEREDRGSRIASDGVGEYRSRGVAE